jgi:2-polyprenyl-3-methyl-5-hydroxy-6-metoxy-1,4-benzoquinol methylase
MQRGISERPKSLRDLLLENYISSSAGPHRALTRAELLSFLRAYRYHLRGWLPAAAEGSWLDLGCGQGALMRLALAYGYRDVMGVDLSDEMLAVARADGLTVTKDDLMRFLERAPEQQWSVVSAFDVVEHFSKEDGFRILCKIRSMLRPGGICLLKLPNASSPWGAHVHASDLTHEMFYTRYSIAQLANLAGFAETGLREVGPAPTGFLSAARWLLWKAVRAAYSAVNVIETGAGVGGIYTRVVLVRLVA